MIFLSAFKSIYFQVVTHFTRLSLCLVFVGCCCIAVFITVLSLFYTFFEPCLNPFSTEHGFEDIFATTQLISLNATISHSVIVRSLSAPLQNVIETDVVLSAISQAALDQIQIVREITPNKYFLRFEREPVYSTLEHCSYEDVNIGISPFDTTLNVTLQINAGSLEVRTLQQRFLSFAASLQSGQVVVGLLRCQDLIQLTSLDGSIKVSTAQASELNAVSNRGPISLGSITVDKAVLFTEEGLISVSSANMLSTARACFFSAHTETGDISITLLDVTTKSGCEIELIAHTGNINVAVKRFSGSFSVKTGSGLVNVPGFPHCDGTVECGGVVDEDQGNNQKIFLQTDVGSITLVFI